MNHDLSDFRICLARGCPPGALDRGAADRSTDRDGHENAIALSLQGASEPAARRHRPLAARTAWWLPAGEIARGPQRLRGDPGGRSVEAHHHLPTRTAAAWGQ